MFPCDLLQLPYYKNILRHFCITFSYNISQSNKVRELRRTRNLLRLHSHSKPFQLMNFTLNHQIWPPLYLHTNSGTTFCWTNSLKDRTFSKTNRNWNFSLSFPAILTCLVAQPSISLTSVSWLRIFSDGKIRVKAIKQNKT